MHAGEAMGVGGFGIQFMRQPCRGKGVGKISLGDEVAGLLELYKEIPIESAKRAMRFWSIRQKSLDDAAG